MFRSYAIIPAAGRAERMGVPKLLLPLRGEPLIRHVLRAWTASGVTRTVVVVRADNGELARECDSFAVDLVTPPAAPADMRTSVQFGLDHVAARYAPAAHDAWLLAPADLVRLTPQLIDRLLAAYDPAHPVLVAPRAGGRRAHPVLIPWEIAAAVRELPPHEGVDALVNRCEVHEIPWPDATLAEDLDTPADYARLLGENSPAPR